MDVYVDQVNSYVDQVYPNDAECKTAVKEMIDFVNESVHSWVVKESHREIIWFILSGKIKNLKDVHHLCLAMMEGGFHHIPFDQSNQKLNCYLLNSVIKHSGFPELDLFCTIRQSTWDGFVSIGTPSWLSSCYHSFGEVADLCGVPRVSTLRTQVMYEALMASNSPVIPKALVLLASEYDSDVCVILEQIQEINEKKRKREQEEQEEKKM